MHPLFRHSALVAVMGTIGLASLSAFRSWQSPVQRDLRERGIDATEMALMGALGRGDRDVVRMLLEAGVPPVGRDDAGRTPLMLALADRDPGLARRMIDAGAGVRDTDSAGESVLGHAVRAGEISIVKDLLDCGVNPDASVPEGGDLATHATEVGRTASAKLLLDAGATRRSRGADGTPITFHAVKRGLGWMLKEILASGGRPEWRDVTGNTLLHAVAKRGDLAVAELLWDHGADPDWKDQEGRTALHLVIATGDLAFARELIAQGASVQERDPDGWTPLMLAVRAADHECTRDLLQAKADVHAKGPDHRTAFDQALGGRDFEAAQMLIDYGAGAGDWLYAAVEAGDAETFDFLMRNGTNPNPERDEAPLLAAIRGGQERIVTVLLDAGARHDLAGREGQKPLHLAMARDNGTMVRDLLAHGVDVNEPFAEKPQSDFLEQVQSEGYIKWHLRNDRRVTPLMMAADRGDVLTAQALIEHGARTDIYTMPTKYWPIGFAARRSDVKMMKVLLNRDPNRDERWVKVDLSQQRAWVYNDDGKTIYSTKVSSGKKGFRTRTGEFVITNKTRDHVSNIYEDAKMPYFQRLSCGDFGFHEGYVPGYAASHGCLRVPLSGARKLWSITRIGDKVVIVP